jgi:hypothetical protein
VPGSLRDDSRIQAALIEAAVWSEVVGLLSDPERLETLALEWARQQREAEDNGGPSLEEIERRIEARQRRLAELYADADRPFEAVELAAEHIRAELTELESMYAARQAWAAEGGALRSRLANLTELSANAAERLPALTLEEQRTVLGLLEVTVHVTGYERRPGFPVRPSVEISGIVPTSLEGAR